MSKHSLSFSASRPPLLSFSALFPDFPHLPWHRVRASLIFFGIASNFFLIFLGIESEQRLYFLRSRPTFSYLPRHRVQASLIFFWHRIQPSLSFLASCLSITYLFRDRGRLSLSFLVSCPNFPHLPRHHVQASLIFSGIASGFLLSSLAFCPDHSFSQASCLVFS